MAMVDDATCITKMDVSSLTRIKNILKKFGEMSGLECNVEKTTLLPLTTEPVPVNISNLGFEIKDEITILGMILNNKGDFLEKNANVFTEKICKQNNFWNHFCLSLPGRIAISKAMLYSQLNYLGSFSDFGTSNYSKWENLITNFAKCNFNKAKDRFFLPVEQGGVGLFKISSFLDAQRLGWLKLAGTLDKSWKQKLFMLSKGNIFACRESLVNKRENPSLFCFISALEKFRPAWTIKNENYKVSNIFFNAAITRLHGNREPYNENFFGGQPTKKVLNLKVSDVLNFQGPNDVVDTYPHEVVRARSTRELTINQYRQLVDSCMALHNKNKKQVGPLKKTQSLRELLSGNKKGSAIFRRILDPEKITTTSKNILKFGEITDTVPTPVLSKTANSLWNFHFLENSTRVFAFKFYNNTLGLNSRVSKFVRGHSPFCTFCALLGQDELEPETLTHLFQDCPSVEPIILNIISWFWGRISNTTTRRDYLLGSEDNDISKKLVWNIFVLTVKVYIWDCKLRFKIPILAHLKEIVINKLNNYAAISKKFFFSLHNVDNLVEDLFR
jgi:hypothetical protein